jgi:2-polyprenyl-3-methyl-5-hydroxy-6-metoxy-1,4-benzoquinol methylase
MSSKQSNSGQKSYPQLILTKGVKEYRQTISKYINAADTVLEIGFAWGTTTQLLSQVCKKVVGIDKGESYCQAVKDYPKLELYKIDAFEISKVIELGYDFNKVYIDVSGCRAMFDVITLIKMYESAFQLDLQVIKSTSLKRFVDRCEVWQ